MPSETSAGADRSLIEQLQVSGHRLVVRGEVLTITRSEQLSLEVLVELKKRSERLIQHVRMLESINENSTGISFTDLPLAPHATIYELLIERVSRQPEKFAVRSGAGVFSYREIETMARSAAALLQKAGIKPGDAVGLMVSRSEWLVACMFGILRLGAAYVPLDRSHPRDRNQYIMNDCNLRIILVDPGFIGTEYSSSVEWIPVEASIGNLPDLLEPIQFSSDAPAYIMYTSGSTGKPKGVLVSHKNVMNFMLGMNRAIGLTEEDHLLAITPVTFDISVLELIWTICFGIGVTIKTDDKQIQSFDEFTTHSTKDEVSSISAFQSTPSLLSALVDDPSSLQFLRQLKSVIIGGEMISENVVQQLWRISPEVTIYNAYGPTETTVWSSIDRLTPGIKPTIGTPIANTLIEILDEEGHKVPVGQVGEICIGGLGVSEGYINQPELTFLQFINLKEMGDHKFYKTGDLGHWNTEGKICIIGRADSQIKIFGHRIELGEIEFWIMKFPGVSSAAVLFLDKDDDRYLVACVASDNFNSPAIRSFLERNLPAIMVPTYLVQVKKMPLNLSGKIDRLALTNMMYASRSPTQLSDEKRQYLHVIEDVLKREVISLKKSFYMLGGSRVQALRYLSKLNTELGIQVTIDDIDSGATMEEILTRNADLNKTLVNTGVEETSLPKWVSWSHEQQLTWQQIQSGHNSGFISELFMIKGELISDLFTKSIVHLIKRHHILRTYFLCTGDTMQQVIRPEMDAAEIIDVADWRDSVSKHQAILKIKSGHPIIHSLVNAPTFKISVRQIDINQYLCRFDGHSMLFDQLSLIFLREELFQLYNGFFSNSGILPKPPVKHFHNFCLESSTLKELSCGWPMLANYAARRKIACTVEGKLMENLRGIQCDYGNPVGDIMIAIVAMGIRKLQNVDDIYCKLCFQNRKEPKVALMPGLWSTWKTVVVRATPQDTLISTLECIRIAKEFAPNLELKENDAIRSIAINHLDISEEESSQECNFVQYERIARIDPMPINLEIEILSRQASIEVSIIYGADSDQETLADLMLNVIEGSVRQISKNVNICISDLDLQVHNSVAKVPNYSF